MTLKSDPQQAPAPVNLDDLLVSANVPLKIRKQPSIGVIRRVHSVTGSCGCMACLEHSLIHTVYQTVIYETFSCSTTMPAFSMKGPTIGTVAHARSFVCSVGSISITDTVLSPYSDMLINAWLQGGVGIRVSDRGGGPGRARKNFYLYVSREGKEPLKYLSESLGGSNGIISLLGA
jgi:hypothetical protein